MFRPDLPAGPDFSAIPAEYEPRVVIKLRDDVEAAPRVASLAISTLPDRFPRSSIPEELAPLTRQFPGAEIAPLFTAASPAKLQSMMRAADRNTEQKAPNLLNFFTVTVPRGRDPQDLVGAAQGIGSVEQAYLQGAPTPPPMAMAEDDPRAKNQQYLEAAPRGIDAHHAWRLKGGDGEGIKFIDIEQGWTLDHEDLKEADIKLVSGVNQAYFGHGTSVLGEVIAQDNTRGCIGITPLVTGRVISQFRTKALFSTADALIAAALEADEGDVILLEAQTTVGGSTYLPVEVELDVWAAISVITSIGYVVIEAGGNGSNNLDNYKDPDFGFILRRKHKDFRESGAIMVGAASSAAPHTRLSFSNYGSRIDCYAWGEKVNTTGDGWKGKDKKLYTTSFGGTSGASPIVTGAAIALQAMTKAKEGSPLKPQRVREVLTKAENSTPSKNPASDRIGVMPDLRKIVRSEGIEPIGDFPTPRKDVVFAGVLIDPGHGGAVDTGASTAYGSPQSNRGSAAVREKDINLDVARRVCDRLGSQAVLTRSGDYNLTLRERIERARAAQAAAFVSIHSNTGRTDQCGPEVWVFGDGNHSAGKPSQQLAQRIRHELSSLDRAPVPVRMGKLAVLRPDLHGPNVAACLVETGSLQHPQSAARLSDARALDQISAAVSRGISRYLAADRRSAPRRATRYGAPVLEAAEELDVAVIDEPSNGGPAQLCYLETGEPHQANWWDAALPAAALDSAPPELRALLGYLEVSYATFAPREGAYFAGLTEHLRRHSIVPSGTTLDASNFAEAVREFQSRTHGLSADGTPGESTLWALQEDWAAGRDLKTVRRPADKFTGSSGYDRFTLREDITDRYDALRTAVLAAGGIITSDGSFRELTAQVSASRSSTSMHYSGLALDLATDTGMLNTSRNPYLVTNEGRKWRVWCRSDAGEERELDAVIWRGGATRTQTLTARVIDFTALAEANGFSNIPPRSSFPGNYMGAEWWHFQCELPLTPYLSQFGIELLSLAAYSETSLKKHVGIWGNRMKIFKRGKGGWY